MTTTADSAAELTEQHRVAQVGVALAAVKRIVPLWQLLDPTDLAHTAGSWLDATVPVILDAYRTSAQMGAEYTRAVRTLDLGIGAPVAPIVQVQPVAAAVRASLMVTGPVGIKTRTALLARPTVSDPADTADPLVRVTQRAIGQAADKAFVEVTGAAVRQVLAGGRDSITASVQHDPCALGYQRRSRQGRPCAFCAMLISRGLVYKASSFAAADPRFTGPGQFKVHDHCTCTLRPVYRDGITFDDVAKYQQIWRASGAGSLSGRDAINAYRRMYDGMDDATLHGTSSKLPASSASGGGGGKPPLPPTGGPGGSADGDVPPLGDLIPAGEPTADDTQRAADAIAAALEGSYGPLRVVNTNVDAIEQDFLHWEQVIQDPAGEFIGTIVRGAVRGADGRLQVEHEFLEIDDPAWRGKGFGSAFSAASEAWYRRSGVEAITLTAGLDDGGYVWALADYGWATDDAAAGVIAKLRAAVESGDGTASELRQARELLQRFDSSTKDSVLYPVPKQVANLGRDAAAGSDWFGRRVMRGTTWRGQKDL